MSYTREAKAQSNLDQWINWTAAVLVAAISMVVFLYSTFETKVASDERQTHFEKHLDRIESKIDALVSD